MSRANWNQVKSKGLALHRQQTHSVAWTIFTWKYWSLQIVAAAQIATKRCFLRSRSFLPSYRKAAEPAFGTRGKNRPQFIWSDNVSILEYRSENSVCAHEHTCGACVICHVVAVVQKERRFFFVLFTHSWHSIFPLLENEKRYRGSEFLCDTM